MSWTELHRNLDAEGLGIKGYDFVDVLASTDSVVIDNISNYSCKTLFGKNFEQDGVFENGKITELGLHRLKRFAVVGAYERLRDDLVRFCSAAKLPQPVFEYREKVSSDLTSSLLRVCDLNRDMVTAICDLNYYDLLLYNHVYNSLDSIESVDLEGLLGSPSIGVGIHSLSNDNKGLRNIFLHGWHYLEPDGIWTASLTSELKLNFSDEVRSATAIVEIPKRPGRAASTIAVKQPSGVYSATVAFDRGIYQFDPKTDKYIVADGDSVVIRVPLYVEPGVLSFETDGLFIPDEYYRNGDVRSLGVKIKSIECL